MELYNQKHIQDFFDNYGELESKRWEKSHIEKVKFLVHNYYLLEHIKPGDEVLELGAGTGMFTKEIANISDRIVVTDLSSVQLKLNQERAQKSGYSNNITDWRIVDICDLSEFEDNRCDKIVCYGGPLSYVFEKNAEALKEIHRVLKKDGIALLSVMNLWGSLNQFLETILFSVSKEANEKIITTGNLHPSTFTDSDHYCHMYTSGEFEELLDTCGFEILEFSASNCLSSLRASQLEELEMNKEKWEYFIDLEIRACSSPGNVETGSHMIAIVQAQKNEN